MWAIFPIDVRRKRKLRQTNGKEDDEREGDDAGTFVAKQPFV